MPTYQKNLGAWEEAIAEKYLKSKGYSIVFRNYRKRVGEIDLVAKKKNKTKRCILRMIKHPRDITTKVVEKLRFFDSQLKKLYGYSL